MDNPKAFYRCLVDHLDAGTPVVVASVLSRSGSAPREAGAAMLVAPDGNISGTIGGGTLEAQVIQRARSLFNTRCAVCETFALTNRQASEEGMLCGGRVEVLIDFVEAHRVHARLYRAILAELDAGGKAVVVTSIRKAPDRIQTGVGWISKQGLHSETLDLSGTDAVFLESQFAADAPVLKREGALGYFIRPIHTADTVYIVGGGHVGTALAPLCARTGFRPVVLDDRAEFTDPARFSPEVETLRIGSYADCIRPLGIDETTYIVIVTRGHLHDQTVLAQALGTDAKYIGMIGSRKKRDAIYAALRAEGFSQSDLERVFCPIGVKIGAHTPAEIAVSIVAEMISVRTGYREKPEIRSTHAHFSAANKPARGSEREAAGESMGGQNPGGWADPKTFPQA